jgi:D-glycero-alpha-D-manno-heptose-7-phosphate kinase
MNPITIKCTAPIRICDLGGWTDTWFAERGAVLNIAVFPAVEVVASVRKRNPGEAHFRIYAENYGDVYDLPEESGKWSMHPLIEAACQSYSFDEELHIDISISSEAPSGASTGTSASVSVAIIGALDLIQGRRLTSNEIARRSHHIETCVLGLQAGIQDQICAATGGISFIEIENYPSASVSPLLLDETLVWELESRLLLVYLGKPHVSSLIHKEVIERLEASPEYRRYLEPLRQCAIDGKEALLQADLNRFGQVMIGNTEAQRSLHPKLVGSLAQQVIDAAEKLGAIGWKVNGAGGDGGSITLLLPAGLSNRRRFEKDMVDQVDCSVSVLPIKLAPHGLRRWQAL